MNPIQQYHLDDQRPSTSSRLSVISEKSTDEESVMYDESLVESDIPSSFFEDDATQEENSGSSDAGGFLQPLERNFVVCVLKDAINQLIIANSGEKHVTFEKFDKRKPMSERFNTPCRDNLVQTKTIEKIDGVMQRMVLVKLRNDTSRFRKILSDTCNELDMNGTYASLKYYVDQESQCENEELELIENYVKNKHLLEHLGSKYKTDIDKQKDLCHELDSMIHELDFEMNVSRNFCIKNSIA